MGVAGDANSAVSQINLVGNRFKVTPIRSKKQSSSSKTAKSISDSTVVTQLKQEAAGLAKPATFRFSQQQVIWISNMMDKHKFNFKAMARDPENHYQETPKAIQHKVRKFMRIPDHYVPDGKRSRKSLSRNTQGNSAQSTEIYA